MRNQLLGNAALLTSFFLAACGGGGTSTITPPPPLPNGPSSGEYLWQLNSDSSLYISTIDSNSGAISAPQVAGSPASNSNGNIPSLAPTPSDEFLYALDTSSTVTRGFSVVGPGLKLKELPSSPFFSVASSGPLNALTLDPAGKFLYVIHSPATIEEWLVNATTGALTSASSVTVTADLRQAVIDPAGKFLFAEDLTGGRIFAYRIDGTSGMLSAVSGSPFATPANTMPTHLIIDPTRKFLYASLFSGGVAGFSYDGTTGALTGVPGSPFPTSNTPSYLAVDPSGKFVFAINFADGAIDGFAVDQNSGALTNLTGFPVMTAPSPSAVVVNPSGNFVYVSIYPDSTIFGFKIDSSTGALSPLSGSPFVSVQNPTLLMTLRVP
jgi:6-phosphogluconolactonase (cycloisomerase 2 family)